MWMNVLRCWLRVTALLLAGALSFPSASRAQPLTPITDEPTGIQVTLPLNLLTLKKATKRGTNWQATGTRLNIDTLSFGQDQTLREVYTALKSIKNRRLTSDVLSGSRVVLDGSDSDGTWFHVTAVEKSGVVRALSIVYSDQSLSATVQSIIKSFVPFPEIEQRSASTPIEPRPPTLDTTNREGAACQSNGILRGDGQRVPVREGPHFS
jgi:hypothetical protein